MKKYYLLICIFILFSIEVKAQTIVASYPFPNYSQYNSFWGITKIGDTLRVATDNNGSIYKVTTAGLILDSLTTPFSFNHGLVWDGSGYWIAEDFRTAGARLFKINTSGQRIDSIQLPALIGGNSGGVGDIALDGNGLWFSIYSPDFTTYPFAYAYKIDLTSRLITDTIPLRGRQVQGITVKGDTIIYVNDYFHTTPGPDPERIYAYRKSTGDTIFSFATPDPDGDGNPRGLHWDGQYLWLIADRVGNNMFLYRTLYKYSLTGAGNPQITTNVNSLDFGNTIIGTSSDRTLQITNTGTANLIISNFNITNPRYQIFPSNIPDTIAPSQSKSYNVRFTPTVFDTTSGQLRITSNDAVTSVKVVSLYGKGVFSGAYIGLSSNSFDYSSRRMNSLSGFTFNVTNQGSAPLQINSVTCSTLRFRFDTLNAAFPITIDTQKTRTFRIWFNPNSTSAFNDSAVFNTNAVNNSTAKISLTGTGQNTPTALGDFMWESTIPSNPGTTSNDYQPKSMKQINDVNGDGINDMIVATENYWTICYNGNSSVTADTLWKFNTYFGTNNTGSVDWEDAMFVRSDIDGDGIQDVVIGCGGGNEEVYCLSGRTGKKIWEYGDPVNNADGDVFGLRVDKDYNNDGVNDVLISASGEGTGSGRHAAICVDGRLGQVIFNSVQNAEFTDDITTLDVGGAVGITFNGGPYRIYGFNNTGSQIWTYTGTGAFWSLRNIPDINADGSNDLIVLQGFAGSVSALSGATGSVVWSISTGSSNNGSIEYLDDLDNNGYIDFTLSAPQTAYRIDSKTGTILWSNPLGNSYIRDADNLGDVNNDAKSEVLVSTQQPGRVYVLDGVSGQSLFMYEFGSTISQRADRVASLKSIDGNVSREFVACSRDGRIKCFSGGPGGLVEITNNVSQIPGKFSLEQNFPNPFNPVTKIKFDIPSNVNRESSIVNLKVYDGLGREVITLVNDKLSAGSYEVKFSGSNFSSGVYFYKLSAGEYSDVKRMVLLK